MWNRRPSVLTLTETSFLTKHSQQSQDWFQLYMLWNFLQSTGILGSLLVCHDTEPRDRNPYCLQVAAGVITVGLGEEDEASSNVLTALPRTRQATSWSGFDNNFGELLTSGYFKPCATDETC